LVFYTSIILNQSKGSVYNQTYSFPSFKCGV